MIAISINKILDNRKDVITVNRIIYKISELFEKNIGDLSTSSLQVILDDLPENEVAFIRGKDIYVNLKYVLDPELFIKNEYINAAYYNKENNTFIVETENRDIRIGIEKVWFFVIMHEVLHHYFMHNHKPFIINFINHIKRKYPLVNAPKVYNMVVDYLVNDIVAQLPEMQPVATSMNIYYDPQYHGMSEWQILERIMQNRGLNESARKLISELREDTADEIYDEQEAFQVLEAVEKSMATEGTGLLNMLELRVKKTFGVLFEEFMRKKLYSIEKGHEIKGKRIDIKETIRRGGNIIINEKYNINAKAACISVIIDTSGSIGNEELYNAIKSIGNFIGKSRKLILIFNDTEYKKIILEGMETKKRLDMILENIPRFGGSVFTKALEDEDVAKSDLVVLISDFLIEATEHPPKNIICIYYNYNEYKSFIQDYPKWKNVPAFDIEKVIQNYPEKKNAEF